MSGECHCHDHDHEGHEHTSIEEAGGCATGFTGTIENFNTDAEMKMADALLAVGKYVQGESGCLLGHIKAAIFTEEGSGLTLNLIDMDNGVEHHGTLARCDCAKFNFMCAVLDVDEHELLHEMLHAMEDSGLDYKLDEESLQHHHHHHDGECHCHDHDDDHECCCHHHHDDDEEHECHCHHHHDDDKHECHCHHYHHDDDDDDHECCCHHHHHDDEEHECHCHKHEEKEKKPGFFSRLFGKKKQ